MEDSLLDVLANLVMTALLAAALCIASVVAAGGLALVIWAAVHAVRGITELARGTRAAYAGRERKPSALSVPVFPRRLRRP